MQVKYLKYLLLSSALLSCSSNPAATSVEQTIRMAAKWKHGSCEILDNELKITGREGKKEIGGDHTRSATIKLDSDVAKSASSIYCNENITVIHAGNHLLVSRGALEELLAPEEAGLISVTYLGVKLSEGDRIIGALKTPGVYYIFTEKGTVFFNSREQFWSLRPFQLLVYQLYGVTEIRKSEEFDVEIYGYDIFRNRIALGLYYNLGKGSLDVIQINK